MKSYQIQKYCVDQQISLSSVGVNQGWNANSSGDDETDVIIAITTKNRDGDDDHRQDPAIFSCPKCDNHENSNRMKSIERLKSFALQQ